MKINPSIKSLIGILNTSIFYLTARYIFKEIKQLSLNRVTSTDKHIGRVRSKLLSLLHQKLIFTFYLMVKLILTKSLLCEKPGGRPSELT